MMPEIQVQNASAQSSQSVWSGKLKLIHYYNVLEVVRKLFCIYEEGLVKIKWNLVQY